MTRADAAYGSETTEAVYGCTDAEAEQESGRPAFEEADRIQPDNRFEYEKTPDGIKLTRYLGDAAVVLLPEVLDGEPVTTLGSSAFYENGMQVEKIIVPGSIRRIEDSACEFCLSLRRMELREGIEELGREFMVISEQMELEVPSTVRRIDHPGELGIRLRIHPDNPWYFDDGFGLYRKTEDGEQFLEMVLPDDRRASYTVLDGTTGIADGAFENQEFLEEITLPASLSCIAEGALSNIRQNFAQSDGIRRIRLKPGNPKFFMKEAGLYERLDGGRLKLIRYIGSLRTLRLPEQTQEIGAGAFLNSTVQRVVIPAGVTCIRQEAFLGCMLREVVFEALDVSLYMPYTSAYFLKKAVSGFGGKGGLYDFAVYDAIVRDEPLNYEKIRMLLSRLSAPVGLTEEERQELFAFGERNLTKILYYFLDKNDLDGFVQLTGLGFITKENADEVIESCSKSGNLQALAILMDYKNSRLGASEFDFSL